MPNVGSFLEGITLRFLPAEPGLMAESAGYALGAGPSGLEVVAVRCGDKPKPEQLKAAWKSRRANRLAPVVVVALFDDAATASGISGDTPQVWTNPPVATLDAICREAFSQPDRHAAVRAPAAALPAVARLLPAPRFARSRARSGRVSETASTASNMATPSVFSPSRLQDVLNAAHW